MRPRCIFSPENLSLKLSPSQRLPDFPYRLSYHFHLKKKWSNQALWWAKWNLRQNTYTHYVGKICFSCLKVISKKNALHFLALNYTIWLFFEKQASRYFWRDIYRLVYPRIFEKIQFRLNFLQGIFPNAFQKSVSAFFPIFRNGAKKCVLFATKKAFLPFQKAAYIKTKRVCLFTIKKTIVI